MEYTATESKKYKQASIGTHTGICFLIADIGTQLVQFPGDEDKLMRQIMLGWELPDEKTDDGKPLSIYKTYTLSFNEKASLAKDYKAWTKESAPKKFNIGQLLGKGCNLNIGHTSGGNAKVTGVSALKANEKIPPLSVYTVIYDLREPDPEALNALPPFIREKIEGSPEYKEWLAGGNAKASAGELDDEIPF